MRHKAGFVQTMVSFTTGLSTLCTEQHIIWKISICMLLRTVEQNYTQDLETESET